MRALVCLGLVAAVAANANAQPKLLDGKWVVESVTRDGKADDGLKGAVREHDGAKYTVTPAAGSSAPAVAGAFVVDAAKSPVTIDMKPTSGRYKDQTLLGIAKLDGDTLTVCFAEPGKDRPTTFESKPGSGWTVAVHKKAK